MKKPWLLLDGSNLAFRSFYAVPELTRDDGFPTNALHGWIRVCWKLEDTYQPQGVLVAFDKGGAQERLKLLPEYKANRKETPPALKQQLPLLRELSAYMGYAVVDQEGIEADDILATYAQFLAQQGERIYLVSADKDLAQCISPQVSQLLPPPTAQPRLGWRLIEAAQVQEKFGVHVQQIPDYLALMGDTSDNIPGLPGVGPKTAQKWLQAHGSLEGILQAAPSLEPKRFQALVTENADLLRRNLQLTTLNTQVLACTPPRAQADLSALLAFLETMQLERACTQAQEHLQPSLF